MQIRGSPALAVDFIDSSAEMSDEESSPELMNEPDESGDGEETDSAEEEVIDEHLVAPYGDSVFETKFHSEAIRVRFTVRFISLVSCR
jgi:hypothetical protein